ncbi:MAG: VCBS repeat-containing protein [Deltaproteobacteria bacterium]|nr:VCBS repeat-containing protein [Deltaproteobacteria bacterium]
MAGKRSVFALFFLAVCLGSLAAPPTAPARQTVRASVATDGAQADNTSSYSQISGDGRYVVFTSSASNLVTGDANGASDIFRRDLITGQTIRVSVPNAGGESNGLSLRGGISDDGRYVVFDSSATNLVAGDGNANQDIFLRDISAGTTVRVSVNPTGGDADDNSVLSSITGDGRYITYYSRAKNLIPGGSSGLEQTYLYDTQTRTTALLSRNTAGDEGNNFCAFFSTYPPVSSSDGRYSAFSSFATNLVTGDTNLDWDVFVRDRQTPQTIRASVANDGTEANSSCLEPFLSRDGRYVSFGSAADNLVAGDTNGSIDIFLHDRVTGLLSRVNLAHDGAQADGDCALATLNSSASLVAFQADATNLVLGDTNAAWDVFVRDLQSGVIIRASANNVGLESDGDSALPIMAANSTYVAFQSDASNLVSGDTNGVTDIFVNGPFLEEAVELGGLELFTTVTGAWQVSDWSPQTGISSAQAGKITDGEATWMKLNVTGPGVLSFWWRVSSQAGSDVLALISGGKALAGPISGNVAWTHQTISLPGGDHSLFWVYVKDAAGAAGSDAGWVDNVQYAVSTRRTMYRAYNVALQYHFFTTRLAEFNNAVAAGYQNESTNPAKLFYMSAEQAPGTVALHRLYNPNSGRHYYTKSNAERDALVAAGWNFERDEGYLFTSADAAPADATEVFHLYHPTIGTHLYTKSASEAAWVVANIPPWQQHTSLGWAYNSLTVGARYAAEADPVSPDSALLRDAAGQAGVDLTRLPAWSALAGGQNGATLASATDSASDSAAWLAGELGLDGEAQPLGLSDPAATGQVQAWRDFDGDGVDDLVWADPATGRVSLALMDATGPRETLDLGTLSDRNWRIFEVRDLDGDGGPDLVWWNPITREVSFWLLTGATVTSRPMKGHAPPGCTLAGAGDYNGDGRVELAWRAADGSLRLAAPR